MKRYRLTWREFPRDYAGFGDKEFDTFEESERYGNDLIENSGDKLFTVEIYDNGARKFACVMNKVYNYVEQKFIIERR